MTFTNSILSSDGTLIRDAIQSEGFVEDVSGWRIERDGDAEFNDVDVRGVIRITGTDPDSYIEINVDASGNPYQYFVDEEGRKYEIRAVLGTTDDYLTVAPVAAPNPSFHIVSGKGIALRSSATGAPSVLFDDADGFLKRGTFEPFTISQWNNVTLQNGWVTTGVAAFDDPSFKREVTGRLWLRGAANGGTKTDGTLLFTLPTGHRPASLKQLKVSGDVAGTTPVIQVETDGEVRIYQMGASNAWVLDEVSFSLLP